MNDSANQIKHSEYPIFIWIIGSILTLVAAFWFLTNKSGAIPALFFLALAALFFIFFASIKTFTVDRMQRTFSISTKSLFGSKVEAYPFEEIANFEVEASRSRVTRQHRNITYRVVMVKTSGEKVPLQSVYSTGYDDKAQKARMYSGYLNLPGWENKPTNLIQKAVQSQAAVTVEPKKAQSGTSSGVAWSIEVHKVGANQVTRWISNDFNWPGHFLLISQKAKGSQSIVGGGGFMGNLMQLAYQQILGIYGFMPGDTPGMEQAVAARISDPRLEQDFSTLTSDQITAESMLNPFTVTPLLRWAQQHPLQAVKSGNQIGQLAVLYSPNGVYVALLGVPSQQEIDEIIGIGVELVKAQGGGQSQS